MPHRALQSIPFQHPAWIEIDLQQFKTNLRLIKQFVGPKVKICLPIKANAYGHGMLSIARAAVEEQIDYLGVSCLQEGVLLRKAGIRIPMLVFGAIHLEQIPELITNDIEISISSLYKAKMVAESLQQDPKAQQGIRVKVHLELETGMSRTGVRTETAKEVLDFIQQNDSFILKGVYTHMATADDPEHPFTPKQVADFFSFLDQHDLRSNPDIICHMARSASLASMPETHLDMIRPGILAFGYHTQSNLPAPLNEIKPCFAVKAKVAYFKRLPAGVGIGYDHTYVTQKTSNLLTIPVGYGDGLRRSLSNRGYVLHNGKRYPIVGNICMDQFMLDLGDDPGYVGDIVTIIGPDGTDEITVEEISQLCGSITYEILCGFNNRLPRLYKQAERTFWEHAYEYVTASILL